MAGNRAYTGVLYPDSHSYDCSEKLAMLDGAFHKWAFVLHDRDVWSAEDEQEDPEHKEGSPKKPHYHWVGYRNNAVSVRSIAKSMGLPNNAIEIAKHGWRAVCRYLIHLDHKEKAQYTLDECTSNFDLLPLMRDEETAEGMARRIFSFLFDTGCTSVSQLVRWSFDNGCYAELRRSFAMWQAVMQENKQEIKDAVKGV